MDGARVGSASGSDGVSLLDTCDSVHVVLVRVDAATGERELVSSTLLEWRAVLASDQRGDADGVVGTALELNGVGPENKVPVGVLVLRLQLVPKCVSSLRPSTPRLLCILRLRLLASPLALLPVSLSILECSLQSFSHVYCTVYTVQYTLSIELHVREYTARRLSTPITNEVLLAQHALERQRQAERERLFLLYAKHWWREYLDIRPQHAQRFVKIFAQVVTVLYNRCTPNFKSFLG